MKMWTIEGNEGLAEEIRAAAGRDALGSAYILSGGGSRGEAGRYLAAAMECRGERPPCGVCAACRKVRAGIHPDVVVVEDAEHKNISTEVLRAVRSDAYILPNEGKRKVYLFPDCSRLDAKSQNVLLKVLEEGPAHAAFLFCAQTSAQLLPTIRSRCVTLRLAEGAEEGPAERDRAEWLCSLLLGGDTLGLAAFFTAVETGKMKREELQALLTETRDRIVQALAETGPGGRPADSRLSRRQLTGMADVLERQIRQLRFNLGVGHVAGALSVELARCMRE